MRYFRLVVSRAAFVSFFLFVGVFLFCTNAHSELVAVPADKPFDHFVTGFPLTGQHQFIACEDCHIAGNFKGTPTLCSKCHDSQFAIGHSPDHVPTIEECDTCHLTEGFSITARMDHSTTSLSCNTCHGVIATGQPEHHISTTGGCDYCHTTVFWVPPYQVDHNQVNGSCFSCHNGLVATGKAANHISTTDNCDACHNTIEFHMMR